MPSHSDSPAHHQQCSSTPSSTCYSTTAYRPSPFLLCALIFWTGISAIGEVTLEFHTSFFSIVTYAPTLHFAVQLIVHGLLTSDSVNFSDTLKVSHRARMLIVSWVLNAVIHIGFWWRNRHNHYAVLFLVPTLPGSQAILVMVFIVIRYTVDIRVHMTRRGQSFSVPRDDEEAMSIDTTTLLQPPELATNAPPQQQDAESTTQTAAITSAPTVLFYQPSLLLLISISLFICTIVLDFQDYSNQSNTTLANMFLTIIMSIQAYVPAILLHSYLILQVLRRETETLVYVTIISGLFFDLIPLWLSTRVLIVYVTYSKAQGWLLIRLVLVCIEILLVTYFTVRYTRCVYAERRRRIELGIMAEDDSGEPINAHEAPSGSTAQPTDTPIELSSFYHPSIMILAISIVLSTACGIIEYLADPVYGIPMSAIVYAPTVIMHLHLIYQQLPLRRNANKTTSLHKFNISMERSMELCLLWALTQWFYVFVWPVDGYQKRKVMNPWIRWPEVVLSVYIAGRYVRDRQIRNCEGGISLPPDPEDSDSPAVEPPFTDSPQ